MKKAERYCNALQLDIPTYKCIYRNVGLSEFDSVLLKCGAFAEWEMIGRNSDSNWSSEKTSKVNFRKVLLGEQFYLENPKFKIDLHFLPYITSSFIRL